VQKNVEPWVEACEQVAKERNPEKLMERGSEVIRLLDEKTKLPPSARGLRGKRNRGPARPICWTTRLELSMTGSSLPQWQRGYHEALLDVAKAAPRRHGPPSRGSHIDPYATSGNFEVLCSEIQPWKRA
jgi:hypothetical protein